MDLKKHRNRLHYGYILILGIFFKKIIDDTIRYKRKKHTERKRSNLKWNKNNKKEKKINAK